MESKGNKIVAQVVYEAAELKHSDDGNVMGVDIGIKCLAVSYCSDGSVRFYGNGRRNKYMRRHYKYLRNLEEMKERKKEMAILNYTTTVDSFKTVSEIEHILVKHNAKSIMKNYDGESITGLSFLIDTGVQQIPVRLPVKIDECFEVLIREKKGNKNIKATREQAERVAWRILKDWVATQMALLDMQMVRFEEIFLPYIETDNGQTVFERLKEKQFLIETNDESKLS